MNYFNNTNTFLITTLQNQQQLAFCKNYRPTSDSSAYNHKRVDIKEIIFFVFVKD